VRIETSRRTGSSAFADDDNRDARRAFEIVIASEAKQSILSSWGEMDCFASLAMTAKHTSAFSPQVSREFCYARSALSN
jgi:hypothetical protein